MYTNVAHLNSTNQKNIRDVIDYDIEIFKSFSTNLKVEQADSIKTTKQEREVIVYNFLNDNNGNYESVAYIQEDKVVALIIMSSRTKEQYSESYSAYIALVKSYFWITDKVDYEKK